AWVEKVVRAIDPQPDDTFIEIGPGRGALTRPLAARAKCVLAYEIDRDLAADLRAEAIPNVTVVEGDVLGTLTLDQLAPSPKPLRVAGDLPYNAASPIMFRLADLFATGVPIGDATLMLQREVADRLMAVPGTREYGVLSVLLQHVATIDMLLKLPAGAFRPAPKVLSALVRLRFHPPLPMVASPRTFTGIVRAVFTRRRKTLANALLAVDTAGQRSFGPALEQAGLDGRRRPETLTLAEFARLADAYTAQK
ncbi:MAG TPA: 16S rRNA (adenine(1518)-N(6)/adenine(1519)-N(6))-dimethyltransferase RsmA, partial [Vicinamibacterales bacterium]|nr:16S rRNA (adenine(1518)-N(6)/adenine(1519)-N(6))-dimethyltransferase RsmA [Vicinamibacterales bacterium]